ncbi:aa3-type cytochrome c oxidase subunit IV [Pelagibacterium lacus]|uniref:Aa3-type cytochrome c oxidase subunit IV n=1 Tax=Pelagibacterium lacus TaxID=2282655 RepID=A0A369W452_9HYPH|nr:aa3-type cytochrome c oxidase subunit IV [Pelagibacterium lacus]RDE08042.1 aa3-type cytochrome c oxidase subunit IV [Pelagibacterium lacus]
MAEEMVATYTDKPLTESQKEKDLVEHTKTYGAFMSGLKWSTIVTAAVLVVLYLVFVA